MTTEDYSTTHDFTTSPIPGITFGTLIGLARQAGVRFREIREPTEGMQVRVYDNELVMQRWGSDDTFVERYTCQVYPEPQYCLQITSATDGTTYCCDIDPAHVYTLWLILGYFIEEMQWSAIL
jgi:hypothetical protein